MTSPLPWPISSRSGDFLPYSLSQHQWITCGPRTPLHAALISKSSNRKISRSRYVQPYPEVIASECNQSPQ